jgi:Uma2 family endonuclease
MALPMPRFRFTIEEYEQMAHVGILTEEDRVELIGGEIVAMSPIGARHAYSVTVLIELLVLQKPADVTVTAQNPIRLPDDSEPQPDITVMRAGDYRRSLPTDDNVLIVIEVSDSTRDYDRQTKLPLYAAARIPEVWIVDLTAHWIERHTDPGAGGYLHIVRFVRGSVAESAVVPTLAVPVDIVLGAID